MDNQKGRSKEYEDRTEIERDGGEGRKYSEQEQCNTTTTNITNKHWGSVATNGRVFVRSNMAIYLRGNDGEEE